LCCILAGADAEQLYAQAEMPAKKYEEAGDIAGSADKNAFRIAAARFGAELTPLVLIAVG